MQNFTGAVEDPRPKKEKKKDWKAEELASAFNPEWKEKKKWLSFTSRNQKRTSSCVPQSVSKILEANEKRENGKKVIFSASKAYADRSNSGAGSYLQEMLKYAVDDRYTLENRIKSQNLTSDNAMEELARSWSKEDTKIAKKYSGKSYLMVNSTKIDEIAHWIEQGQVVSCLFYFTSKEWGQKYPKILNKGLRKGSALRHAVAITDFGLIRGKKYLKIEDSAHFGGRDERWVSEEFLTKRTFGAGFVYDKPNKDVDIPVIDPKWRFKSNLWLGMRNYPDVVKMQDILKQEGFFPLHIPSTGNYLEITRRAVEKYQRHHELASIWELNAVRGKIVGPKTRRQLNA